MKKQLILACLLFFLLITGSVSQVVAAETRGDTLFNEAYTEVQVLINEIDRTSQYYNYIPAVDHFLDAVADEGIASSKKLSSQRNEALELLKQQLDDLYEERRVARLEYEDLYTQYLTEGKFAALEALEQKYKGQVERFDNQERSFRNSYDQTVTTAAQKLWNLNNNLTLTVEETKMDVLAAEQIYHKCQEAEELLKKLPYEDLGYAKIDQHRKLRQGFEEVIYCQGKETDHLVGICRRMAVSSPFLPRYLTRRASRLSAPSHSRIALTADSLSCCISSFMSQSPVKK